jgi:hypothetical protein
MYGVSLWPREIPKHILDLCDGPAVDAGDVDRNVSIAEHRAARLEQTRSCSRSRAHSKSTNRVRRLGDPDPDSDIGVGGPAASSSGPAALPAPREPRPPSRPRDRDPSRTRDRDRRRDPSGPRDRDRDREGTCAQRGNPVFNRVWSLPDNRFHEVCRLWNMEKGETKCPRTPCQCNDSKYPVPRLHVCLFCLSPDHRRWQCPCERGERARPRDPSQLESHDWDAVPRRHSKDDRRR